MRTRGAELAVALGLAALGGLLVAGALPIPSEAGYGGVGPNFLPWVVAVALVACAVTLLREAATGGFRDRDAPDGADRGDWIGFVWVSAGLLSTALLIERIGFVLACALCFVLAVRGFERSQGRPAAGLRGTLRSAFVGVAIAAPVYWLFGRLLSIKLPGLTTTGWL